MKVINGIHARPTGDDGRLPTRQVATIGFFDGVHLGHRYLIRQVVEAAGGNRESMVITFDRHPKGEAMLLTPISEKIKLLGEAMVDNVAVLAFDHEMAALSAHDFMQQILRDRLHVEKLILGYDNRFGHNRAEGFDDYVRYGRELGIEVVRSSELKGGKTGAEKICSSVIRRYLMGGEVEQANRCLGYPYLLTGSVVQGYQEGRKMGFPTANLDIASVHQLIPETGVYAVKVRLAETEYHAMMNIGHRPTFDGHRLTLEVHLFCFNGDLYGQQLHVAFMHRIREERKFASPEELAVQLQADKAEIEAWLKENDKPSKEK